MKLSLNRIYLDKLITPANYGIHRGIDRKIVYYLMKVDRIDYTEIDGVKFVVLNPKSKNYINRIK